MVAAWEARIKTKGTPLLTFFESWSKVNKIQKRKRITKNDEIAGELPMIKRARIAEKEDKTPKPENKGPLVLFPSDSEGEETNFKLDEETEKPKKAKLKKKANKKKEKKKEAISEINIPDKEDVVQDFSVSDW